MKPSRSLKAYILFWIIMLAIGMSGILTYQSTQYFLEGFLKVSERQMIEAAELLPEGEPAKTVAFDYHVASSWEYVPEQIKRIYPKPPKAHEQLDVTFEDWWYFSPPKQSYSLLVTQNKKGQLRYISRHMSKEEKRKKHPERRGLDPMVVIALWGVGSLVVFIGVIFYVMARLATPVQALYVWAKNLDLEKSKQPCPDFNYTEFNQLARIVQSSILKAGRALERERAFLGFASHELRTPIATLRSNATLLDKVTPHPSAKEREVRDRILRASLNMKEMTETLLWLSRDADSSVPHAVVDIEEVVLRVIDEQQYLLTGKPVKLSVDTSSYCYQLPTAAFNILVTNLIRNAFQHTATGNITITQKATCIQVSNSTSGSDTPTQVGFGLGLKLINTLVERFHWKLQEDKTDSTLSYTVYISTQPDNSYLP